MSDTISACATAPGLGAIAIVRLSGPQAIPILHRLCPELRDTPPERRATLARVQDPISGELLDRALVTVYREPRSYTGEDMVEISCHGGWLSPREVVDAAVEAGAREAEPGEFTRRAYLNGKLDLIQAEAVLDVVEGRSRALRSAALHQLERGLSQRVSSLREALVDLEALLAHHIDFPEEDDAPVPAEVIAERAGGVASALRQLLRTAPEGELLREGAVTVLAGRPNSGKSSLFNALLGRERAIVTEIPGTTRDALEAVVSLGGFPFRLVDTAGIRESDQRVERIGVEVARRYLDRADLVLLCTEATAPDDLAERAFMEELGPVPVVLVQTKADLLNGADPVAPDPVGREAASVVLSALTGEGLDELRRVLPELAYRGLVASEPDAPVLTRKRQSRQVEKAAQEVEAFARALREGIPPEVAATHLRPAETALEELLGVISVEDVLDRVFSEFCVGK